MDALLSFALLGLGAFFLGLSLGFSYGRRHPLPLPEPEGRTHHCPTCKRERTLPPGLEGKLLLCNLCQVRLRPGAADAS